MRDTWRELQESKVCAIDIDDTIACSIDFFIDYVNKELKEYFKDLGQLKNGLSYNQYRQIKEKYRTSGVKRYIPMTEGADVLTKTLHNLGYKIIIITARPADKYPELTRITTQWLNDNDIIYDSIIFNSHKHIKVLEQVPNLEFSINDHRTETNLLSQWNYKSFLLDNAYNKGELGEHVIRIKDLLEVLEYIKK